MTSVGKRPPRRNDDRVILQFDYDCFYAQVVENARPELRKGPLGIKQKHILATCNYHARRRGVGKLMSIVEAKKRCPELVLVDGEDLTQFRDTSKTLFNFLRSQSWNGKVERLGFDEVFMDVTDMVDYNMFCLNRSQLANSFFYLSKNDPEQGFPCDLTAFAGHVIGSSPCDAQMESQAYLRLLLGSHLAQYLRLRIERDFGYTSTCGIATSKLLSKLVGSRHKPQDQTTLLALRGDDTLDFLDDFKLRQIPGLGSKFVALIEAHLSQHHAEEGDRLAHPNGTSVSVGEMRAHPSMSPGVLDTLLAGPGAERGVGARVWNLVHGIDLAEVKTAVDYPSQISIEGTYQGLETLPQITEELHKLSLSLVRRLRADLVVSDTCEKGLVTPRWIARPKTLRLSIRYWPIRSGPHPSPHHERSFSRTSRSGPLPNFIFDCRADVEDLAQTLVVQALLPLFRRLQEEKSQRWSVQLVNVCVAGFEAAAADSKTGAGRDISKMLQQQDELVRPWRLTEMDGADGVEDCDSEFGEMEADSVWDSNQRSLCSLCRQPMPNFALAAHARYHELGD